MKFEKREVMKKSGKHIESETNYIKEKEKEKKSVKRVYKHKTNGRREGEIFLKVVVI